MAMYKYVGGSRNGKEEFLFDERPDGYEFGDDYDGFFRVVKSGVAGPDLAGFMVCLDQPAAKATAPDYVAAVKAAHPKKFKVYRDRDRFEPIVITADCLRVEDEVLFFSRGGERIAAFWSWDYAVAADA